LGINRATPSTTNVIGEPKPNVYPTALAASTAQGLLQFYGERLALTNDFEIGGRGDDSSKVELQGRFAFTLHAPASDLTEESGNGQLDDGAQTVDGHRYRSLFGPRAGT